MRCDGIVGGTGVCMSGTASAVVGSIFAVTFSADVVQGIQSVFVFVFSTLVSVKCLKRLRKTLLNIVFVFEDGR